MEIKGHSQKSLKFFDEEIVQFFVNTQLGLQFSVAYRMVDLGSFSLSPKGGRG